MFNILLLTKHVLYAFQPVSKRMLLNARLYPAVCFSSVTRFADVLWLHSAVQSPASASSYLHRWSNLRVLL